MKGQRMCPNESCEHYRQPTSLMGGCDCGTALVPYRTEPTNEQLARFAAIVGLGYVPEGMAVLMMERELDRNPELRATWIERHREFQAQIERASALLPVDQEENHEPR